MLAASTRLGPYEIADPLGVGGMGEVYRARDTRLGREVAVKVLPEAFAGDPHRQARFEREARAVAALSHPNILAIHDYGTEGTITYAVMELLEGETLRGRLAKGALPWREVVEIGAGIADGLAAAHAKGIVHRDLKPENLFLTADGRVKILDFGLARVVPLPDSQSETGPYVPAETDAGTVLGTVGYMSPEQVRGQPADARSDLFSFGCVLHEMATGRRPFQRETAAETMTAILHDEPPDPANSGNPVPADLGRLVRQCLAKNANQRLQSARDLAIALRTIAIDPELGQRAPTRNRRRAVWAAAVVVLASLIGTAAYLRWFDKPTPNEVVTQVKPDQPIDSLAVLPLANASGDPELDFLGDGISDGLINRLSQLPNLRIMARSTVFRYKGKPADPKSVGRELSVRAVLAGQVAKRGDTVTIQLDLVDATDGALLWGEQFQVARTQLPALQEDLPRRVAAKLRLTLSGEQERRLAKRYTENSEAYQAYLRGRFYQEQADRRAIDYFKQAIAADPTYALAYSGLADAWSFLGNFDQLPPDEAYREARAAAQKALELDEELAEAHASLGLIRMCHDRDWVSAERDYKRAIALNPGYAAAHSRYAWHLGARGKLDEAILGIKRTLELDPKSLNENMNYGWYLYMSRRYDAAEEQLKKTLEMDANYSIARIMLGSVYVQQKRHAEAIAEFREAVARSGNGSTELAALAHAHAIAGQTGEARKVFEQLRQRVKEKYVSPYNMAVVHAGLGEVDEAFDWLEKAYDQRVARIAGWTKVDPRLDPLRKDPRFTSLLRRLGLDP